MKTAVKKVFLATIAGVAVCYAIPVLSQDLVQDLAVATVGTTMAIQAQSEGQALEAQAKELTQTQLQAQEKALQAASSGGEKESPSIKPLPLPNKEAAEDTAKGVSLEIEPAPPASSGSSGKTADVGIVTSPPLLGSGKGKPGKGDSMEPGKVPEAVKNVVKRLNVGTEDVTLEDLNEAREAVAKLDMLIDIEKRLSDLETIRQEREEKSVSAAIPASALGMQNVPPPVAAPQPFPSAASPVPMPLGGMSSGVEIERIQGAGGRYVAFVKSGEGKTVQVREGEKLSDGSVVQSISSQGVTLLKDKNRRTLKVKDVGLIFGAR